MRKEAPAEVRELRSVVGAGQRHEIIDLWGGGTRGGAVYRVTGLGDVLSRVSGLVGFSPELEGWGMVCPESTRGLGDI